MSVCDWYCKECGKFKERCVCEKTERVFDSSQSTGSVSFGMDLATALKILERNKEAMGHAKALKFSDDELIAILTYRQSIKQND